MNNTFNKGKKDKSMIYKLGEDEYTYLKMFLAINNITFQSYIDTIIRKDVQAFKLIYDKVASDYNTDICTESPYYSNLEGAKNQLNINN